jgi:hypothetical protein
MLYAFQGFTAMHGGKKTSQDVKFIPGQPLNTDRRAWIFRGESRGQKFEA